MNHVITSPNGRDLGFGCSCGNRYPTKPLADKHAEDSNLIEANAAKAQAAELERQAEASFEEAAQSNSGDAGENDTAPVAPHKTPAGSEQKADEAVAPTPPPAEAVAAQQAVQTPQKPAAAPATQLGPASLPLDLNHMSLNQINFIGQMMAASGMFPDVTDASKALVKILAGQEIGVTPFQAMTNIHIIQGKATMGANLLAAKVKGSGKYDYRIKELTNELCTITFKQRTGLMGQNWDELGEFSYSIEDAKRAGLVKPASSWEKYPQNMLFARAISSGTRLYCPDVFNGNLVYVPEELGAEVNEDGEIVKAAA